MHRQSSEPPHRSNLETPALAQPNEVDGPRDMGSRCCHKMHLGNEKLKVQELDEIVSMRLGVGDCLGIASHLCNASLATAQAVEYLPRGNSLGNGLFSNRSCVICERCPLIGPRSSRGFSVALAKLHTLAAEKLICRFGSRVENVAYNFDARLVLPRGHWMWGSHLLRMWGVISSIVPLPVGAQEKSAFLELLPALIAEIFKHLNARERSVVSCVCCVFHHPAGPFPRREIHVKIVKVGLEGEVFIACVLVDMYAKCTSLTEAEMVFDRQVVRDVVLWNVVIAGYAEHGHGDKAMDCLGKMRQEGVSPNTLTFVSFLHGYDCSRGIGGIHNLHIEIGKEGLESDSLLGSALVDLYAKCGALSEAQKVFNKLSSRNVISWTALISGYADHGFGAEALNRFTQMQLDKVLPNDVTFVCTLKACGLIGALGRGRELHAEIATEGYESDAFVGNTLVDMYARCGMLLEARDLFDELRVRDVVSWNALCSRYLERGCDEEALKCLEQMLREDVIPDFLTYVCCVKACGCLGAIDKGQQLHAEVSSEGFENDSFIGSTLVDMYAKCGLLTEARDVFNDLASQDIAVWNALLTGYAFIGEYKYVFKLFETMKEKEVKPNGITFLSVLTACSHGGLVLKGLVYFQILMKERCALLTMQHYNCIVDLLGRAGHLEGAVAMLKKFPSQPNLVTWSTLLGACRKWGDIELARQAFESAYKADEKHTALFISMSRVYAGAHMWEDAKMIEGMRLDMSAWAEPERSLIEVEDRNWWQEQDDFEGNFLLET